MITPGEARDLASSEQFWADVEPDRRFEPVVLAPELEQRFQRWVKGTAWYRNIRSKDPKFDVPAPGEGDYDYRRAWIQGISPDASGNLHWPSVDKYGRWLKAPWHRTAWKEVYLARGGDPRVLAEEAMRDARGE